MMHPSTSLMSRLILVLTLVVRATAFWRMDCHSPIGHARIDPIVNPGGISEHMHSLHGGSSLSGTSNTASLLASKCTSCLVTQDNSAYWTPTLYFKDASGKFTLVPQVGGMLAYYLLYPNSGDTKVTAFPNDFKMIAGDTKQRNFTLPVPDPPKSLWVFDPAQSSQAGLRQKAIGFNCLNYNAVPEGTLYRHFLPDKAYIDANCPDGIRAELQFPSCWNGRDIDSPDHKSHVAYPSLVMTGDCPDGYPVRLVTMLFETILNTAMFKDKAGTFVFSNGDPTGYGYHGDFMMGWDENFLQSAINTCTNPSGQITDCPLFNIQSQAKGATCQLESLPAALANEDAFGPRDSLPGNVQIYPGPGYASSGPPAATGAPVPTLGYASGSSIPPTATLVPGGIFAAVSNAISTPTPATPTSSLVPLGEDAFLPAPSSSSAAPSPPPPPPPPPPPATTPPPAAPALPEGELILTTIYQTHGLDVVEIVMVEEVVTVTQEPITSTVFVPAPKKRRSHIHRHRGRGR